MRAHYWLQRARFGGMRSACAYACSLRPPSHFYSFSTTQHVFRAMELRPGTTGGGAADTFA